MSGVLVCGIPTLLPEPRTWLHSMCWTDGGPITPFSESFRPVHRVAVRIPFLHLYVNYIVIYKMCVCVCIYIYSPCKLESTEYKILLFVQHLVMSWVLSCFQEQPQTLEESSMTRKRTFHIGIFQFTLRFSFKPLLKGKLYFQFHGY